MGGGEEEGVGDVVGVGYVGDYFVVVGYWGGGGVVVLCLDVFVGGGVKGVVWGGEFNVMVELEGLLVMVRMEWER